MSAPGGGSAPGRCLLPGGGLLQGGVCSGGWGGVWSGGVSAWGGGCGLVQGGLFWGYIPACTEADTPPCGQTDACENITLAQLRCGR